MSKNISASDIANDIKLLSLWSIVVSHLTSRPCVCICCPPNSDGEADERFLEMLREIGFGETITRAQKDYTVMMEQARRERKWFGGPYTVPIITGEGFLLRYVLEDAQSVFEKKRIKI